MSHDRMGDLCEAGQGTWTISFISDWIVKTTALTGQGLFAYIRQYGRMRFFWSVFGHAPLRLHRDCDAHTSLCPDGSVSAGKWPMACVPRLLCWLMDAAELRKASQVWSSTSC